MNDNIEQVNFGDAISERYLAYALSTIMSRSLPDVRDGLKPVHRRLLYAMMKLRLEPSSGYKKCARVVGDVIGKYHPHGDTAVYDTLVRLAQNFSLRYPLIDGQGNFGSIDGDNAAAMRYTESRMTEICMLLMQDLDKDTVDFRATYDNSDSEPMLLPAAFPNLLANGSEGIAVGMATSIPPHNLHELCEAMLYLIDHPDTASCDDILNFVQGPDFPTGGIIVDSPQAIKAAYACGKGSFRVRAKWHKDNLVHGLYQIIITEIPYQVQKAKIIEQIAELLNTKKLPLITNIRDESTETIRIVIEPKNRSCDGEMIMESLFKLTDLESRVQLNMNVLASDSMPKVMSILDVLKEFLAHRKQVILRRSRYQIDKIKARLEVLEALKIAFLNIDEVIRIIREEDEPKTHLINAFGINDNQAEAILNIRLRSLRKLEEQEIAAEHKQLNQELLQLEKIISEDKVLWNVVKNELLSVQQKFSRDTEIGARKTYFQEAKNIGQVIDITAFIEKEPVTIICSKMGWIRSVKGYGIDSEGIKFKEGDELAFVIEAYTTSHILICASNGKFFTILADNISKGKGHGESLKLMVDLENSEIVNILPYNPAQKLLLASDNGKGFIVSAADVIASTKNGKQVMNVQAPNVCVLCKKIEGDTVAIIGSNRKMIVFALNEIPEMKRGKGVTLQKYKEARLEDVKIFSAADGLSWKLKDKTRTETDLTSWRARRGAVGKLPPVGFPKNNRF
jgi:topoisomerase-4 subunit A